MYSCVHIVYSVLCIVYCSGKEVEAVPPHPALVAGSTLYKDTIIQYQKCLIDMRLPFPFHIRIIGFFYFVHLVAKTLL